jgi:DhnA family fructose-bisphosphate aldolase class Ia
MAPADKFEAGVLGSVHDLLAHGRPSRPVPPRLRRLFARDGKCLDVAVDHGFFGEPAFLTGIERMGEVVATLAAAGPDAVQLSPGQAPLLQAIRGPEKPALVLRSDVANVYHPERPERLWSEVVENAVGRAIALDAACVVVNLLLLPGEPELYRACLVNAGKLRVACDEVGMPLMIEPLAMLPGAGGYGVDGDVRKIVSIVRQAAELGADIIKADPTSDLEDYHRVVEAAAADPCSPAAGGARPTRTSCTAPPRSCSRERRASCTGATSSSTTTPPR